MTVTKDKIIRTLRSGNEIATPEEKEFITKTVNEYWKNINPTSEKIWKDISDTKNETENEKMPF